ncbi:metallophosphoesterase [Lapidilactobacillus gannanensis]|uniref:Metallophosphoesterase n=1 Tax=Lapidilactobacillus gannanensis TaxID=2486002 RepID=A0ABW4BQ34_9LACO|nr:metallophosphoesterase [Lapidilactobacillus gannanensis]
MSNLTFIGDIHGAADDLTVLLSDPIIADSQIIFLGDYIDGLNERKFSDHVEYSAVDPIQTLAIIRERVLEHHDIALLGNHEDFWIQTARRNDFIARTWQANGGLATWPKLGITKKDLATIAHALNQPPLQQYTDFLSQLPIIWQMSQFWLYMSVFAGKMIWLNNIVMIYCGFAMTTFLLMVVGAGLGMKMNLAE